MPPYTGTAVTVSGWPVQILKLWSAVTDTAGVSIGLMVMVTLDSAVVGNAHVAALVITHFTTSPDAGV